MTYLFYELSGVGRGDAPSVPEGFSLRLEQPSVLEILRPSSGLPLRYLLLWAFEHLGMFANGDYHVMSIFADGRRIHRSGVFPRYFRYPFMDDAALQIGNTWTDEGYRGKGLATIAAMEIVRQLGRPGRRFWYVTTEDNVPSQRVIEKAGFRFIGNGRRTYLWGIPLLGAFQLDSAL